MPLTSHPAYRGSIFLEEAVVLDQVAHPREQFVLRVRAPRCAAAARPGSFAHITCAPDIPMRRPLSIMRTDPEEGTVEFLYKIVGHGLARLARRKAGESISVLGPIGQPFRPDPTRPRAVLIGGGVGIPPMIFLAKTLASDKETEWEPLVLMGSEVPFPFDLGSPGPYRHLAETATGSLIDLDVIRVASRLASGAGLAGCFPGFVTQLAESWLAGLSAEERDLTSIYACGPTAMLAEAARVARSFGLPCQVSLEEFMACAVGGCAGCTVAVRTPEGVAMKRVCVDGPVFDAETVFPPAARPG